MGLQIHIRNFPAADVEYLEACARIRNMGKSAFFRRLLQAIAKDQMVLSILDDDSKPSNRPGEYAYKPWNKGRSP